MNLEELPWRGGTDNHHWQSATFTGVDGEYIISRTLPGNPHYSPWTYFIRRNSRTISKSMMSWDYPKLDVFAAASIMLELTKPKHNDNTVT